MKIEHARLTAWLKKLVFIGILPFLLFLIYQTATNGSLILGQRVPSARTLPFYDRLLAVAFSPDGKQVVGGGEQGTVGTWDIVSGQLLRRQTLGDDLNSLAFSPDGKNLLSGGELGVRLYDGRTGQLTRKLPGAYFYSGAFSPDGKLLAAGTKLHVWQAKPLKDTAPAGATQDIQPLWTDDKYTTLSVVFSPDSKLLLAGVVGGLIMRDAQSGQVLWSTAPPSPAKVSAVYPHPSGFEFQLFPLAFSPDNKTIVSPEDGIVERDKRSGAITRVFTRENEGIWSLAFSHDGSKLATTFKHRWIRVWDTRTGSIIMTFGGNDVILSLAFSPDDKLLASGGMDMAVNLWNM